MVFDLYYIHKFLMFLLQNYQFGGFSIYLGSIYLGQGTRYVIKRAIPHPAFNAITIQNDIALIEVTRNIQLTNRIKPVCLPTKAAKDGEKCHVSGFGRTGASRNSPSKFFKVILTKSAFLVVCPT